MTFDESAWHTNYYFYIIVIKKIISLLRNLVHCDIIISDIISYFYARRGSHYSLILALWYFSSYLWIYFLDRCDSAWRNPQSLRDAIDAWRAVPSHSCALLDGELFQFGEKTITGFSG